MGILKGVIGTVGKVARSIRMDPITNVLIELSFEHAQIHDGDTWRVQDFVELAGTGSTDDFIFRAPAGPKQVHINWINVRSESEYQIDFYRAPTLSADGTLVSNYNANDNILTSPSLEIYTGPTVTAVGTRLGGLKIGAGGSGPGAARDENEFILRASTDYLYRITKSTAGADYLSYVFGWYETTPKNPV